MLTVFAVLVAVVPFAVVFVLLAWTGRRQRLRRDAETRQIALTDRIHERLGAVAAPVVRRRRGGWRVSMAVPFERPTVTNVLLAIVQETLAPSDDRQRPLEIIVTRQPTVPAPRPAERRTALGAVSWT